MSFDYEEVIKRYFNTEAKSVISNRIRLSAERFFTLWTRKEALTKATAKGIDDNLKSIPALDGAHSVSLIYTISSPNDWLISSFKLNHQYCWPVLPLITLTDTFMFEEVLISRIYDFVSD